MFNLIFFVLFIGNVKAVSLYLFSLLFLLLKSKELAYLFVLIIEINSTIENQFHYYFCTFFLLQAREKLLLKKLLFFLVVLLYNI